MMHVANMPDNPPIIKGCTTSKNLFELAGTATWATGTVTVETGTVTVETGTVTVETWVVGDTETTGADDIQFKYYLL